MGHFTQAVEEKTTFDGDEVAYSLRRMQNKHMVKLAPLLVTSPSNPESALVRTARMVEGAKDVIKDCISNFRGVKDSSGADMTLDAVLDESYFLPLLDELLGRLLQVSVRTGADEKKLDVTPRAPSSGVSVTPTPLPES